MSDKQIMGTIGIVTNEIENVEWVFQFNDDKPIYLASPFLGECAKELTFTIGNNIDSSIIFNDNKGNQFKIFAREKNYEYNIYNISSNK